MASDGSDLSPAEAMTVPPSESALGAETPRQEKINTQYPNVVATTAYPEHFTSDQTLLDAPERANNINLKEDYIIDANIQLVNPHSITAEENNDFRRIKNNLLNKKYPEFKSVRYPPGGLLEDGTKVFADTIYNAKYCGTCNEQLVPKYELPGECYQNILDDVLAKAVWEVAALTGKDEIAIKGDMVRLLGSNNMSTDASTKLDQAVLRTMERYKHATKGMTL